MIRSTITVSQLNYYMKSVIESDEILRSVLVRGEISNFSLYRKSGHMYFTLKDGQSAVKAVMFRSDAEKLNFIPEDGMSVVVSARVSVFERDGVYQLYVSDIIPDGIGAQMIAFFQLKEKLEKEGLFDEDRKKPLPRFPEKIAVATSPSGAALQDILSVTGRRYPIADIEIYPCVVQGAESAESVIRAVNYFNRKNDSDVIIIARGGGSYEDLASFNDERLARTIANSNIPIISAVGHESDFTIADFVADMRAPTPSAAAEIAVPDIKELSEFIGDFRYTLKKEVSALLNECESDLEAAKKRLDIRRFIENKELVLDKVSSSLCMLSESLLEKKKNALASKITALSALDPLSVIGRGYSVVYKDEKPVSSAKNIEKNDKLVIKMKDGEINCVAE
jgi:exodeoxyribonuclease VII large subunit